jgi:ADP-heptose:LPS heptosyltransferase
MTGPYLAKNRLLLLALASVDSLLRVRRLRRQSILPVSPRRVLLALGGHLGDAVVATAAIEHLHRELPHAEIGVVLPTWSRIVLEGDPRLRWLHSIDHWKFNREQGGRVARWRRYRATSAKALSEIRRVQYDVAVDLYGYFPNMSLALWRAGIPVRLGFVSGGFGDFYTHPVPWEDDLKHVAERQVELVGRLAPARAAVTPLRYSLPAPGDDVTRRDAVSAANLREPYIVLHMGSGAEERQWPAESWQAVASRLAGDGHFLVFTGRGPRERAAIAAAMQELPNAKSLCDHLQWPDFVDVIRRARLVLTVETAAAHVAAATDTPCVALWSGITSAHHWGPLGSSVSVLTHRTPCAPCFRSRGCTNMSCVRDLTVPDVLSAMRHALESARPPAPASRLDAAVAR